jgi:hypothetical protein
MTDSSLSIALADYNSLIATAIDISRIGHKTIPTASTKRRRFYLENLLGEPGYSKPVYRKTLQHSSLRSES